KGASATVPNNTICGTANPLIPAAWAANSWFYAGGWTMYTANCAGANSSAGIHGCVIDPCHSDSTAAATSTRVAWNVGDSPGTIIFCAQASGSDDAAMNADCPVTPNGLWGVLEQKGAQGLTVSRWIGHGPDNDTPPPGMSTCSQKG